MRSPKQTAAGQRPARSNAWNGRCRYRSTSGRPTTCTRGLAGVVRRGISRTVRGHKPRLALASFRPRPRPQRVTAESSASQVPHLEAAPDEPPADVASRTVCEPKIPPTSRPRRNVSKLRYPSREQSNRQTSAASKNPPSRSRPPAPRGEGSRRRSDPKPPSTARDIKLEVSGADRKVEVRLVERAGEVHFAVRTPDGPAGRRSARATSVALLETRAKRLSSRGLARGRRQRPRAAAGRGLVRPTVPARIATAGSGRTARSAASRTSHVRATPKKSKTQSERTAIRMAILLPPLTSESSAPPAAGGGARRLARWTRTCSCSFWWPNCGTRTR